MPEKYHTRAMLVDTRAADSGGKRYRFRASTAAVARDGMVLPADAWDLTNYRSNPVVLIAHDMLSLPIGRAVSVDQDSDGLIAEIEYDSEDPRAQDVMRKLDGGFLNAVSVSFRVHEWASRGNRNDPPTSANQELLEISNVAVPSDVGALALRSDGDGRSLLRQWLDECDARTNPPESDWSEQIARLEARIGELEALTRTASAPEPAPEATPAPAVDIDLSQFPNLTRSS